MIPTLTLFREIKFMRKSNYYSYHFNEVNFDGHSDKYSDFLKRYPNSVFVDDVRKKYEKAYYLEQTQNTK